jgi:exopolysaccharide biosynthesis polyprenyl glycosylphosphotransferase
MTPSNRHAILKLVILSDIVLLFDCLGIAYSFTFRLSMTAFLNSLETRQPIQVFIATIILAFAWHATLRARGFYNSHRCDTFSREMGDIFLSSIQCALFSFLWLVLIAHSTSKHHIVSRLLVAVLFCVMSAATLTSSRFVGRVLGHALRSHGRNIRHIIIIGSNHRAHNFAHDLVLHPEWGYRLQGYVDVRWHDQPTTPVAACTLLGSFDDLPALLRAMPVDEIMVSLPIASFYRQVSNIVDLSKQHGIAVRTIGSFFDKDDARSADSMRGALGTVTLHDNSWSAWASLFKSFSDIAVSFILLIALAPVFLLIIILIKLTSPGPIFFVQARMGYGKRLFQILKFRTMVINAEKLMARLEHLNETQGPTFKLKNDPRITPIGRFLRKTSLDEIPQLVNVLLGDMSLVGPRPLPLRDYQGFSEDWHRRRFSVKPGITCLWQVMGRSSITFDEWMALDMRYIDQWSVWLDFKILLQTIPAVFRGSGAV